MSEENLSYIFLFVISHISYVLVFSDAGMGFKLYVTLVAIGTIIHIISRPVKEPKKDALPVVIVPDSEANEIKVVAS